MNVFYAAGALGIKQTVPAFQLHDNLTVDDLATGVCFASGGSGNDDFTAEFLVRSSFC